MNHSMQHKLTALFLSIILFLYFIPIVSAADSRHTAGITVIEISKEEMERNQGGAISKALLTARDNATEANIYKIVVPEGTYYIYDRLEIYSNTWLSMNGVTLVRSPQARNMLRVGKMDSFTNGVTGYHYRNITIEGGVFDAAWLEGTVLKIGHAKNVMMKNVSFYNSHNYHFVETAAVDGLTVTGCSFNNQLADEGFTQAYEALQLDIVKDGNFYDYRSEDLCMQNVLVENCSFNNCPRGVGSHTSVYNNPHKNITVRNNTFTDMGSAAIQTLGWTNSAITGNVIDKTPRGIAVYTVEKGTVLPSVLAAEGNTKQHYSDEKQDISMNIVVADNVITNSGSVTDVYAGYERIGVAVMGNEISDGTLPNGIHYCENAVVKNNYITLKGNGVRVEYAQNVTVAGNVIRSIGTSNNNDYGIVLRNYTANCSITGNYIKDSPVNGINVDKSAVTEISSNEIYTAGKQGINLFAADVGTIQNNEIRDTGKCGIYLKYNSKISGMVTENRIMRATDFAVKAETQNNDTSAVTSVYNNTFYKCGGTFSCPEGTDIGCNYTDAACLSKIVPQDKTVTLEKGACYRNTRTVSPVNALYTYSYSSSDSTVASVTEEGLVTALSPGTATICVTSSSGVKESYMITVQDNEPAAITGDIDGDGYVTPVDYAVLSAHVAQIEGYEAVHNADLNADGAVDAKDRVILAGYLDRADGYEKLSDDLNTTAANSGALAVTPSATGDEALIPMDIAITENPGVSTADFDVSYDGEALVLEKVDCKACLPAVASVASQGMQAVHFSVINDLSQTDSTANGVLAILYFSVKENAAAGSYSVSVDSGSAQFFNAAHQAVPFTLSDSKIEVASKKAALTGSITAPHPEGFTLELIPAGEEISVQTAQTDASGSCVFENVVLGEYSLRATKPGYIAVQTAVSLTENTSVTLAPQLIGDVNGDGLLTVFDATAMQRILAEFKNEDGTAFADFTTNPEALQIADINADGQFTIDDITTLQRLIAEFAA